MDAAGVAEDMPPGKAFPTSGWDVTSRGLPPPHHSDPPPDHAVSAFIEDPEARGLADREAGRPISEPVRIKNVIGTVLHTLFDVGALRLVPGAPREIAQTMTGYEPIAELMP